MPRSKLLDKGEEVAVLYPEVRIKDARGLTQRQPGKVGYPIRVTVTSARMTASDVPGQVSISAVNMITRYNPDIPFWDWARLEFRGEEWDVKTPPHLSSGASRATRHWEFEARSRNRLGGNHAEGGATDG